MTGARSPVSSAGPLVDFADLLGEPGIADRAWTGPAAAAGVEGGSGDLQQFTRARALIEPATHPPDTLHNAYTLSRELPGTRR